MFIKAIPKSNKKGGKTFYQYKLVASQRIDGKPRHRTVLNLGYEKLLDDPNRRKPLADCIELLMKGRGDLMYRVTSNTRIHKLAEGYYQRIFENTRESEDQFPEPPSSETSSQKKGDWQEVDLESFHIQQIREIGAEWLCYQAIKQLKLDEFLRQKGFFEKWVNHSLISIIGRAVYRGSEHKLGQILAENSGLEALVDRKIGSTTRHHLYDAARELYKNKEAIENYLAEKTEELFPPEDRLVLYDLTNTYFEGVKAQSDKARFGKSKEKRSDCRLIVLAVVVNTNGFIKYSRFYKGNMSDDKTLPHLLDELTSRSAKPQGQPPVVVIDAGIATENNLRMLERLGYDYMCVALGKPKNYQAHLDREVTTLKDQKGYKIHIQRIHHPESQDRWLYVRSQRKTHKEAAMDRKAREGYEQELENIKAGIHKKYGTKKLDKVNERIGRAKQSYPSAHKNFELNLESKGDRAIELTWKQKPVEENRFGTYFLRTSLKDSSNEQLWRIYNLLKEVEYTFRLLKTELRLRPVYHITDDNTQAHLFLGLLAYQVVCTIRHQLKARQINYDWQNIVRKMNTQKIATTAIRQKRRTLHIHDCSRPIPDALKIYKVLNYSSIPFRQKKSVVPH
mgnify:FL=1